MIGSYVRNLLRLTKSSYGDGTKATGTAIAQDGQLIVSHSWQTAFLRLRTHHNVKVPLVSDTVTTMESNQGVRINGAPVTRNGVPPVTNKQQNHHQDANVDEISAIAPNAISTDTVLTTSDNTAGISRVGIDATMNKGVADFFSPEIFNIVLHNPTTAHQLLRFSQNRFCGENMEFLEKVLSTDTLQSQNRKADTFRLDNRLIVSISLSMSLPKPCRRFIIPLLPSTLRAS